MRATWHRSQPGEILRCNRERARHARIAIAVDVAGRIAVVAPSPGCDRAAHREAFPTCRRRRRSRRRCRTNCSRPVSGSCADHRVRRDAIPRRRRSPLRRVRSARRGGTATGCDAPARFDGTVTPQGAEEGTWRHGASGRSTSRSSASAATTSACRIDEAGHQGGRRRRARRRHHPVRHRRHLRRHAERGVSRRGARTAARPGADRDEVRRPDRRRAQGRRERGVRHACVRRLAAPARHRSHRPVPAALPRPGDAARRDARRARRARARGQGARDRLAATSPPR